MKTIRFGSGREYRFFRKEEMRSHWTHASAQQFLLRFKGDTAGLEVLRSLVPGLAGSAPNGRLNEEQLLARIAAALVKGEIVVALPNNVTDHRFLDSTTPAAEPVPQPAPVAEQETEEEDTFETSHDVAAQVQTLIAAAENGTPFCEECERRAHERESQQAAA